MNLLFRLGHDSPSSIFVFSFESTRKLISLVEISRPFSLRLRLTDSSIDSCRPATHTHSPSYCHSYSSVSSIQRPVLDHQPITGLHFVDWQLICILGHAHLSVATWHALAITNQKQCYWVTELNFYISFHTKQIVLEMSWANLSA